MPLKSISTDGLREVQAVQKDIAAELKIFIDVRCQSGEKMRRERGRRE